MKGHVGAVITSGLAMLALEMVLLQAIVLRHTAQKGVIQAIAPVGPSNRWSAPGGRSGIPWAPFDRAQPADSRGEGRTPPRQQEERHAPPAQQRYRSLPPRLGPQMPRKLTA